MKKIFIFYIISMLVMTAGCGTPSSGTSESLPDNLPFSHFEYLPSGYSDKNCIFSKLPDRQQTFINADNGAGRIIYEVIIKDRDISEVLSPESVTIKDCIGTCYIYGSTGEIKYPEMDESIRKGLLTPIANEAVIEWEGESYNYRIFGSLSKEILICVANGLVGE